MEEGAAVEARVEVPEEARGHRFTTAVAVTTAVLAALAAYTSMLAGRSAHHSLAELNQAAIYQNLASDQWNFYQAKGIKRHIFEVQRDVLRQGRGPGEQALAAAYDAQVKRYAAEQAKIRRDAEGLERRRDEAAAVAQRYDARYERLALAVAFFQLGIVVSSVAAIVRRTPLLYLGLLGGAAGLAFLLQAFLVGPASTGRAA